MKSAIVAVVVDRDTSVRNAIRVVLDDADITTIEAETYHNGISKIRELNGRVELLFIGWRASDEYGGLDLALEVDDFWPHIEIVLCSEHLNPNIGQSIGNIIFIERPICAEIINEYLCKPLNK